MYENSKDNLEGEQLGYTADLGTYSAAFLSTANPSRTERGFKLEKSLTEEALGPVFPQRSG
jgi:hypothetical protein